MIDLKWHNGEHNRQCCRTASQSGSIIIIMTMEFLLLESENSV